jgi:nitronate monooxygenase
MLSRTEPIIIQGGMGVAVSAWPLARAVSLTGQLGVVAGTALDVILARRLQLGDPDGHVRRAMAAFPLPNMADRILKRYFIPGGKAGDRPFITSPMHAIEPSQDLLELTVVSNFVEVYLAKEEHDGLVGINYLEKVQLPTLPSLFGALLGGVDYVLMGAGIPRAIPGILDSLCKGEPVELPLDVHGANPDDRFVTRFDPVAFTAGEIPRLVRPKFLAIIASESLAKMLARKASGRVDGFVVEGPTAGGHNAPPRGLMRLNDRGEPVYGGRDEPNLEVIRSLGRPFWLAGSYGVPERVTEALDAGAAGVQVGTAFAYCEKSGLPADLRRRVLAMSRQGTVDVLTDPAASPTGFPLKIVTLSGTLLQESVYEQRKRICDLGFLRHPYKKPDGTVGLRCPSEPVKDYIRKGGAEADTRGRKCVCNGLPANVGVGQVRRGGEQEKPLVTSGDDVRNAARFLPTPDAESYSAEDVVKYLLSHISRRSPSPLIPLLSKGGDSTLEGQSGEHAQIVESQGGRNSR